MPLDDDPLESELITLCAVLACFEIRPVALNAKYGVAIPHAQLRRYLSSVDSLRRSDPEVSVLPMTVPHASGRRRYRHHRRAYLWAGARDCGLVTQYLQTLTARGVSVVMIEQKLTVAMRISERAMVMGDGSIVFDGTADAHSCRWLHTQG